MARRAACKLAPEFVADVADMPEAITRLARGGDVLITMGAGSIGGVPARLLQMLEKKS